jgi:AcrR family transcriptional regulator
MFVTNTVRYEQRSLSRASRYDGVVTMSRRDRPAKPPLSRAAVVQAGLAILQKDGFSAVTMRSVAAALDTGPASLYAYVGGRDELLREMLNAVLSEVRVPEVDPSRWREQLKDLLRGMTRAMEAHPGIARVALGYIPVEEQAMIMTDRILQLLAAGGIGPQASGWAVDLLALYTTATAYESSLYVEQAGSADAIVATIGGVRAAMEALPRDRFPLLSTMARVLTIGSGDERFDFGLDVLINGLLATPEPTEATDPVAGVTAGAARATVIPAPG